MSTPYDDDLDQVEAAARACEASGCGLGFHTLRLISELRLTRRLLRPIGYSVTVGACGATMHKPILTPEQIAGREHLWFTDRNPGSHVEALS